MAALLLKALPPLPLKPPLAPSPQGGASAAGRALLPHLLPAHPGSHSAGEGGVRTAAGTSGIPLPGPQRLHSELGGRAVHELRGCCLRGEGGARVGNDDSHSLSGPLSPVSFQLSPPPTANCQSLPTSHDAVHRGCGRCRRVRRRPPRSVRRRHWPRGAGGSRVNVVGLRAYVLGLSTDGRPPL